MYIPLKQDLLVISLLLALLAVGFLPSCTGTDRYSSATLQINIAEYGAVPDDDRDDTRAIQAALEEIRNTKGKTVLAFAPGRYDFFPDSASRVNYPVTAVHKQWDFVTPFHLDELKNLLIDGGGSAFVMHGRMTPFVLNSCKNVRVKNISIEHERPSVFELKVISRKNEEVIYEVVAGDQFIIEENQIVWLDADDQKQYPNVCQYYDPGKDYTKRCPNPFTSASTLTREGSNRVIAKYKSGADLSEKIQPGTYFQFRNGLRNQSGAVVFECEQIAFEQLNIYSWNGLGFVCQFCRDLTFKDMRMEPDPGSGRTNAGFADAIQVMATKGEILIENSRFVGLHDDHINIYGQMMKVTEADTSGSLTAVFTSNETEGFLNFRSGDSLILRNPATFEIVGEYKVTDSELADDKTMHINVDGSLPVNIQDYWIENLTWVPDKVIIRGNYFGRVPTRSILMYLARESVIENNTFHRIPMTSILIQCPDHRWALQNHIEKLSVRNNVFFECENALIRSNPQVGELASNASLYGEIVVVDNLIVMKEHMPYLLDLRGFSKVDLGTNRIELVKEHPQLVKLIDCNEIKQSPQLFLGMEMN